MRKIILLLVSILLASCVHDYENKPQQKVLLNKRERELLSKREKEPFDTLICRSVSSAGSLDVCIIQGELTLPFIYGQDKLPNKVKFIQGNHTYTITNVIDSIILKRKPFSIRYFCDYYDSLRRITVVTRIAVLDNPAYLEDLYVGMPIDAVPFFHSGTGMAAGETGYDNLIITNEAHHFLYYENETDKRSELISKKKGKMELEWKIYNAYYKEEEVEFADLKLACVYFVIVADNNDDGKIQMDELKIIRVTFKGEARN